jgi:hypothetical protein
VRRLHALLHLRRGLKNVWQWAKSSTIGYTNQPPWAPTPKRWIYPKFVFTHPSSAKMTPFCQTLCCVLQSNWNQIMHNNICQRPLAKTINLQASIYHRAIAWSCLNIVAVAIFYHWRCCF